MSGDFFYTISLVGENQRGRNRFIILRRLPFIWGFVPRIGFVVEVVCMCLILGRALPTAGIVREEVQYVRCLEIFVRFSRNLFVYFLYLKIDVCCFKDLLTSWHRKWNKGQIYKSCLYKSCLVALSCDIAIGTILELDLLY